MKLVIRNMVCDCCKAAVKLVLKEHHVPVKNIEIDEVYEPFLIMEGYLQRTPHGRPVTERAYRHLGRCPA